MTADLNGPDLGVLARGSDRRSQVIAEKLIEGILTLGLTTAMFWVGGRMMKSVLNPPSEGAARARKRVATMLGIDPSRLVLNTYEATLSTCVFDPQHLGVSIADVAGLDHLVEHLCASVKFMRAFPNAGGTSMLASSKGLLLYGPPGTGKTMVAKAFAAHVGAILINITASTVLSKWLGDSNKLVQAIFTLADKVSRCGRTAVVFVDEVDALLGDVAGGDMSALHQQIQTEFMQLWDGLVATERVVVVGATNRPNLLNDAMWRRFGTHLEVPLPDEDARYQILRKKLQRLECELCTSAAPEPTAAPNTLRALLPQAQAPRAPAAAVSKGRVPEVPRAWLTDGCRTTLQRHASPAYRTQDVDLAARVFDEPMHPLRRAAKLTDRYNGSDLVEVVKRAVRRRWHALNGQPLGASAANGAAAAAITEQDLMLAIAEVKPAAKTARRDETRSRPNGANAADNGTMVSTEDVARLLSVLCSQAPHDSDAPEGSQR